jgi:hypothetical protein
MYHDRTAWHCAFFVGTKYGSKGYAQRNAAHKYAIKGYPQRNAAHMDSIS